MFLLSVQNLTVFERTQRRSWLRRGAVRRTELEDVSFELQRGQTLGIVGEAGSGKDTLVSALLKLREISSGEIVFAGVETISLEEKHFRRLRRRVQAVFAEEFGQLTPEFTVDRMFQEVLRLWHRREDKESCHRRIERVMVACGLPEAVRALYPAELDEVERQEVAMARALLPGPELLVCHDFTRGLDTVQEAELLNLVVRVRDEFDLTLLLVTDDLAVAHQLSDTICVLHRGRVLEMAPAGEVVNRPRHDYTKRLVSCSL